MSTERSIPHLRDIFGLSNYNSKHDPTGFSQPTAQPAALCDLDKPSKKSKKSKGSSANGNNAGHGEIKTLERHLSMKKTIRKKIMRDLQQAFVDDPNEFKVDNSQDQRLRAEINLEAIRYGEANNKHRSRDNFLDMLRGEQQQQQLIENNNPSHHQSSNSHSPRQQSIVGIHHHLQNEENNYQAPQSNQTNDQKQSFWSRFGIRNKNKR